MMPRTLQIDLRFKGVGRINLASGTTDPKVLRKIKRALRDLQDDGRLDVLRAIRDGHVTILEVYNACRQRTLHELPIGDTLPQLATAMQTWITGAKQEYSANHLVNLETARRYFKELEPTARVADLPRLLKLLREQLGAKHPRSFNLARGSATSFIRHTLGRAHPVYLACAAVEPRKVRKATPKPVFTPADMRKRFPNPATDKVDAIAWSMLTTGMGSKEYWGRWHSLADRVHIDGTKRSGRVRDVPLIQAPAVPRLSRDRFTRVFRERLQSVITPYDLRRTYAKWLELAKIPRTRRRLYMGHGAKDVTDLYEAHEVTAFLLEDAKTLRFYVGLDATSPVSSPIAIAT
jgi:integrase